jgi:hypothetical protein
MGISNPVDRHRRATRRATALGVLLAALLLGGCATGHPGPIARVELAKAQTFPYYRIYWVGPRFDGRPLAAADGLTGYISTVGDSVYYGDCVHGKGIFGGGTCQLPLQVTTVIYHMHNNSALGPQRNILVRGVPATVYDGGRSIELYTGRVTIDVFSDTLFHALQAAGELMPLNAPGSARGNLPLPVYCPELAGEVEPKLQGVLEHLPRRACQRLNAAKALKKSLSSS